MPYFSRGVPCGQPGVRGPSCPVRGGGSGQRSVCILRTRRDDQRAGRRCFAAAACAVGAIACGSWPAGHGISLRRLLLALHGWGRLCVRDRRQHPLRDEGRHFKTQRRRGQLLPRESRGGIGSRLRIRSRDYLQLELRVWSGHSRRCCEVGSARVPNRFLAPLAFQGGSLELISARRAVPRGQQFANHAI